MSYFFLGYVLEALSYFIFFISLLVWIRLDKRGVIKILCGYYFISGLIILKTIQVRGTGETNIYFYSVLCILSSFSLGAYFYNIIEKRSGKYVVFIVCAVNGIYFLNENIVNKGHVVFDSMAYVILSTTIVVLSFMYTIQLLQNVKEEPLSMSLDFWFVAAQLVYFIGSFVIFLTFGYLTKKAIEGDTYLTKSIPLTWLWGIHNVLLFLSALLTLGGTLWIYYRRRLE